MTSLPGDPGPLRRVGYALGMRLPPENRDWVRHDLTDAGWRFRLLSRHVGVMVPVALLMALLPGAWWVRLLVAVLVLLTSTLAVVISADDLRRARLHRHGLPGPQGRTRGPG